MSERALSGRRIIVLGGTNNLGQSVTDRFRADASMVAADVGLPASEDRHDDVEYVIADAPGEASVSETLVEFAAVLAFLVSDYAALISGAAIPVYSRA